MTVHTEQAPEPPFREGEEVTCHTAEGYDPTKRSCGWCYAVLTSLLETSSPTPCPNCPRLYCSPACCVSDQSTHSFWCGKTGEKGIDFDVCNVQGKGFGLITKRAFERGEKILAERPVMTTTNLIKIPVSRVHSKEEVERTNESILVAAMSLTPLDGDLEDKVNANGVSLGIEDSTKKRDVTRNAAGLFLTFSRVNHDCLGNSDHYFDHQHGVELLVANDAIPADTEITFPYARTGKDRHSDLDWRGFICTCPACRTPALDCKVNQMSALDLEVVHLGAQVCSGKRAKAVAMAHTLLGLYDEVNASCRDYARIHYDLFQILVTQQASLDQAHQHMVRAYEYALSFCGYENHATVVRYKELVDHPELHGNYKVMDD